MINSTENNKSALVAIQQGPDPYQNTLAVLKKMRLPQLSGKTVLLKPNAGRLVKPGLGITTEPQVVAAACDFFFELGALVTVGESTIVGVKPLDCLALTGMTAVAQERGLPVLDLDARPAIKTPVDGLIIDHLKVCAAVPEFDYVVSIPVMKTHMHCQATLSLKNMKGCLRGREKVRLHQLPKANFETQDKTLDIAVADLSTILAPDLAIVDGTLGMEGLGPSGGETKAMNLVLASTDYLNADFVAATLMGFAVTEIPHIRLAAERAGHSMEISEIEVTPENWLDMVDPFARPPKKISMEFPDVIVKDKESCSACVSTLMMFLKRYYKDLGDYLPLELAIGKAHDILGEGTLCIGNCTKKACQGGVFVKGCPPVSSEIMKKLEENLEKSEK